MTLSDHFPIQTLARLGKKYVLTLSDYFPIQTLARLGKKYVLILPDLGTKRISDLG